MLGRDGRTMTMTTFTKQSLIKTDRSRPDDRPFPSQLTGLSPHPCKGPWQSQNLSDPWCLTPALSWIRQAVFHQVRLRTEDFLRRCGSQAAQLSSEICFWYKINTTNVCSRSSDAAVFLPPSAHECLLAYSHLRVYSTSIYSIPVPWWQFIPNAMFFMFLYRFCYWFDKPIICLKGVTAQYANYYFIF